MSELIIDNTEYAHDGLLSAAIDWWKGKRPCEWGEEEHHKNPSVNCVTPRERVLAREISNFLSL